MAGYLDLDGLTTYDGLIKDYIGEGRVYTIDTIDELGLDTTASPDDVFEALLDDGGMVILPTGNMTDDDWNTSNTGSYICIANPGNAWTVNPSMPSKNVFLFIPRTATNYMGYIRFPSSSTGSYEGTSWKAVPLLSYIQSNYCTTSDMESYVAEYVDGIAEASY